MMSRSICLVSASEQRRRLIGDALGALLGRRVVDPYAEVSGWVRQPIEQLRQTRGEQAVIDLQRTVVREIAAVEDLVIVVDPDILADPENARALDLSSVVVAIATDAQPVGSAQYVVPHTAGPEQAVDAVLQWAIAQGDVLTPSEHEQVML